MEKQPRSSEEIDLLYFFNPVIKGVKTYVNKLQRGIFLFVAIFLICIAIGFSLRFFSPKYFRTNAIYVSYLPADFSSSMINNLQNLIDNKKNISVGSEYYKKPIYRSNG